VSDQILHLASMIICQNVRNQDSLWPCHADTRFGILGRQELHLHGNEGFVEIIMGGRTTLSAFGEPSSALISIVLIFASN
jgi:hypothetical protein